MTTTRPDPGAITEPPPWCTDERQCRACTDRAAASRQGRREEQPGVAVTLLGLILWLGTSHHLIAGALALTGMVLAFSGAIRQDLADRMPHCGRGGHA